MKSFFFGFLAGLIVLFLTGNLAATLIVGLLVFFLV